MPMDRVFVLTDEPYCDNSTVVGVYGTLRRGWDAAVALATMEPDQRMEITLILSEWLIDGPGPAVAWWFCRFNDTAHMESIGYKRLPFQSATQGLWVGHNRNLQDCCSDKDFELPDFVKGEKVAQV